MNKEIKIVKKTDDVNYTYIKPNEILTTNKDINHYNK